MKFKDKPKILKADREEKTHCLQSQTLDFSAVTMEESGMTSLKWWWRKINGNSEFYTIQNSVFLKTKMK